MYLGVVSTNFVGLTRVWVVVVVLYLFVPRGDGHSRAGDCAWRGPQILSNRTAIYKLKMFIFSFLGGREEVECLTKIWISEHFLSTKMNVLVSHESNKTKYFGCSQHWNLLAKCFEQCHSIAPLQNTVNLKLPDLKKKRPRIPKLKRQFGCLRPQFFNELSSFSR